MLSDQYIGNLEAYKLTYKYTILPRSDILPHYDIASYAIFTENNEWQDYNYSARLCYRIASGPQNSIASMFHTNMEDSQGYLIN